MQLLGGDVAVALLEQQLGERQALARRPQADAAQSLEGLGIGAWPDRGLHGHPLQIKASN